MTSFRKAFWQENCRDLRLHEVNSIDSRCFALVSAIFGWWTLDIVRVFHFDDCQLSQSSESDPKRASNFILLLVVFFVRHNVKDFEYC